MRVVELNGDLVGQRGPIIAGGAEAADEVGQRAGDEKVFLKESQTFALRRVIVGIQHARDRLGGERFGQRADEIAAAELGEVEIIRRLDGPQAQRVDGFAAIADHGPVIRNADQRRRPPFDDAQRAVANLERHVELHFHGFVGPRHFPRIGPGEPVVGLFGLPAVADALPENAVVVAQAIAHAGNAEGRHRIEKTRRQPAQAAVAETGVRLLLDDLERIELVMFGELLRIRVKPKIGDVVGQGAAEQKFHREVINALGVALPVSLLGFQPALRKHIADGTRDGFELVAVGSFRFRDDLVERDVPLIKRIGVAG